MLTEEEILECAKFLNEAAVPMEEREMYDEEGVHYSNKRGKEMPILLSPEEIEALSEEWLEAEEDVDWADTLCRAQLRKVVEWLWGDCDDATHADFGLIRIDCNECGHSLKEEAGL